MSRWHHSKNTYSTQFLRTSRWYDIFRGWTTGTFQSFRNNVSLPLLFSTIWTDVARKMNISFGVWPYVSMFGYGPEDTQAARKNELLVSAQLRDTGVIAKASDMFLMADLYGTAVCQVGWEQKKKRLRRREVDLAPISGMRAEKIITEDRTVFDGPQWEVIDILDFFPQPGVRSIAEMDWVIRRYYLDLDHIELMSREDGEAPGTFDRNAYLDLKNKSLTREVERELSSRQNLLRSPFAEQETRKMEKYAKPVEILEMWGTVPSEFAPDGAMTERVISIANRQVVLRNQPNPFWHGEKPFLAYSPLRDPHFFHGIGKIETGEKMQLTMNRIANQKLDALDIFLDPVFAYDRSKGVDTRNLYMRSGKLVGVNGSPSDAIMPIVPNLSQIQNAYQEIEFLWRMMQTGTGITEGFQNEGSASSRTTAREFLARQENVSVRLLLENRFAEEIWIEPMVDQFRALNKQFLETPHEIKILGVNALVDPITGNPIPPEVIPVDLEDLNHDYDVRARGATQTIGKAARQQNIVLLLQAIQANPMAMQMVNWQAFLRDMFQTFEMGNTEELLQPTPAQQAAMAALQGNQLPPAGPMVGGGFPEPGIGGAPMGAMDLPAQPGEAQIGSIEGTLSGA